MPITKHGSSNGVSKQKKRSKLENNIKIPSVGMKGLASLRPASTTANEEVSRPARSDYQHSRATDGHSTRNVINDSNGSSQDDEQTSDDNDEEEDTTRSNDTNDHMVPDQATSDTTDTWSCLERGCSYKVQNTADAVSRRQIQEHIDLHAYDDDSRVRLARSYADSSQPTSNLMRRLRQQAMMEGDRG